MVVKLGQQELVDYLMTHPNQFFLVKELILVIPGNAQAITRCINQVAKCEGFTIKFDLEKRSRRRIGYTNGNRRTIETGFSPEE